MARIIIVILIGFFFSGCHTSRKTVKTQPVIIPKDTAVMAVVVKDNSHEDSLRFISKTYKSILNQQINFTTFSAKIDIDYTNPEGKEINFNAHIRMYKDSVLWVLITGPLGIEGIRAFITKDSVKILDRQEKEYKARSVAYLQEVTALPLDLTSLQNLLLGNPVFLDSTIISYSKSDGNISLHSDGRVFKNIFTINEMNKLVQSSRLDNLDNAQKRSCFLTYAEYENKKNVNFATKRIIDIADKTKMLIKLNFKQYEFNETLSFPFSVPKNYKRN